MVHGKKSSEEGSNLEHHQEKQAERETKTPIPPPRLDIQRQGKNPKQWCLSPQEGDESPEENDRGSGATTRLQTGGLWLER